MIVIFDDHNMALPVWGQVSNKIGKAGALLTFDTHTDTRPPFTDWFSHHSYDLEISLNHPVIKPILKGKHFKRDDFSFEDAFKIAAGFLKNDEHITTSYHFGYISSYDVVCRLSDSDAREFERQDRRTGFDAHYYSSFEQIGNKPFSKPLFLDFDFDYFINSKVINENFYDIIKPLVKQAEVITIAREPNFVKTCCPGYAIEDIYNDLMKLIKGILEE